MGEPTPRKPTTGVLACCADVVSGHTAAARDATSSRRLVCRERSIVRGDGGRFTTLPPSRLEARSRLGDKAANELGAPVVSSIPAQLPGPEPASARKGREDDRACFGGIDVSQDRLDVLLLPQGTGFSVANDEAGWSTLIGWLRGLPLTAIGLEPSGGYERGVLRALLAAGLSVHRINPNRLRQFARARGALAKNDRLDARLIAEYVATTPTHVVRHDPAAARIAEIVTVRRQLCDEHVAIENQAAQLEDAMLRRLAKRRLARIETDIRLLDK